VEDSFRDRLIDWVASVGSRQLVALAVVGVVTLGGGALWYVRSLPRPVTVSAEPSAAPSADPEASASPAVVIVHVAGLVRRPGVYELPEGSRVIDAIEAAGGAKAGADLAALNLAAVLADAQQILVPKRGAGGDGGGGSGGGGPGGGDSGLVNINTASLEELETLPGVGPVLAQSIIDYREEHGPFTRIEDLMNVSGIGEKRFEDLKDKVTV
jgi:competence protein ComEA